MMIQTEHRNLIAELVKLYKVNVYMELGIKDGYTFNRISKIPCVREAIGIDIKLSNKIISRDNTVLFEMNTDRCYFEYLNNVEFVDLLFIDACHDYKQYMKDFYNYSNLVKSDTGLILLHDTCPRSKKLTRRGYCSDAWKLARLIRHDPDLRKYFEICTLPGPVAGISIVRKSNTILPWREDYPDA
jgi:hypothetical protein